MRRRSAPLLRIEGAHGRDSRAEAPSDFLPSLAMTQGAKAGPAPMRQLAPPAALALSSVCALLLVYIAYKPRKINKIKPEPVHHRSANQKCCHNHLCTHENQETTTYGHSRNQIATTKRQQYIPWDDYFMSLAVLSSYRSKDPSRQVGAVIVNPKNKRIVGIGYNGFPIGCSDDELPWSRNADREFDTKYPYVCHAEMNAIMNKNAENLEGNRMYVTLFPCNECAKLIVQSRIAEVVFFSDKYHDSIGMQASRRILDMAGVKYWALRPNSRVVIDFSEMQDY